MQKVILREAWSDLPPGTVLDCDDQLVDQPGWLTVAQAGRIFHLEPAKVLFLRDYLRRQPADCFWTVERQGYPFNTRHLCHPQREDTAVRRADIFGVSPFRFESEGELRYCLRQLGNFRGKDKLLIGCFKSYDGRTL